MDSASADRVIVDVGGWISGSCGTVGTNSGSAQGAAERILMVPHMPLRPSWRCRGCRGDCPWPCLVARLTLKNALSDLRLREAMTEFLHDALADGFVLSRPTYGRFYSWIDNDPGIRALMRIIGSARPDPRSTG
jgi:hypothetical protein